MSLNLFGRAYQKDLLREAQNNHHRHKTTKDHSLSTYIDNLVIRFGDALIHFGQKLRNSRIAVEYSHNSAEAC
jgi:hypothetical protein